MKLKTTFLALAAALAVAIAAPAAMAGTSTATMAVSATVGQMCDVTGTPPTALAFGNIAAALSSPVNGTSTITVNCNATLPFTVGLAGYGGSAGLGYKMKGTTSSSNLLVYNLYQDSAHSIGWGNSTGNTESSTGVVGSPVKLTVYGQIPAGVASPTSGQNALVPVPDTYNDTVTVTVSY